MGTGSGRDSPDQRRTVIFVGHARLPHSLVSPGSTAVVSVEMEVDLESGRVIVVGTQGLSPCSDGLVRELVIGEPLDGRIDAVLATIQARYMGPSQRAICCAVASAHEAYLRYCRQAAPVQEGALPRARSA